MVAHGRVKKSWLQLALIVIVAALYVGSFNTLYPYLEFFTGSISLLPIVLAGIFFQVWGGIIVGVIISAINYFLFRVSEVTVTNTFLSYVIPNSLGILVGALVGWSRRLYIKLQDLVKEVSDDRTTLESSLSKSQMIEHALTESETRFRQLFHATSDIVCFVDQGGFITEVNPAGEEFIGYESTVLRELQFTDILVPEYCERVKRIHLRQFIQNVDSVSNEAAFITNSRQVRWLGYSATLIHLPDGTFGFYILGRDITHQKDCAESVRREQEELERKILDRTAELTKANQALQIEIQDRAWIENALRESEDKYRSLVENLDDVVFRLEADNTIAFINTAWERMTGYSISESAGKNFLMYVAPESQSYITSLMEQIKAGTIENKTCEFMLKTKSGHTRWINMQFIPCYSDGEGYAGIEGLLHDITDIKIAEDALQNSKDFLDQIVNSISEPIFVKDDGHRWVLVNDSFAALIGQPKDAILGKSDYDFLPKEQADVFWEKDATVLESGLINVNEEVIRNAEGEDRLISTTKRLYQDDLGHKFIVGIIRDITEEKKFERRISDLNVELDKRIRERTLELELTNQELRGEIIERKRAEEQLRLFEHAFKSVHEGVFITTLQGTLLFTNPTFCSMYGYSLDELEGKNIFDIVKNGDLADMYGSILSPDYKEHGWEIKLQQMRNTGESFLIHLSLSVIRNSEGTPLSFVGFVKDISEDERISETLRHLSNAIEQSPVAIVITDLKGNIEYINEQFCSITGYAKEEISDKNIRILKSGETKLDEYRELWQTITSGSEWRGIFHNKKKNGELYWDSTIIYPMKNESNVITHYIAFKEDISDQRKLEAQIRRSQRLEVIGTLAGGIAHDLNNVLSPILMAVQLLRMKISDPKGLQLLTTLEATVNRGADIVKQILAFARGNEGERMLLQPKHLLREVYEIMQETFPRQISVQAEIPKDLWPVVGDATQLHQVFMNLCVNARDAMPHGGGLTIRAENVELTEKQASLHVDAKPGPYVMISVIDTGIGIPQENLDKIFDPFFTTKEVGKGTGLGLATVQTIVRSHQGFVTVYSEVGHGTNFKVYVPAAQNTSFNQQQLKSSEPPKGKGELVLLIDDEISIREVTKQLLENSNYKVIVAKDGAEALELFKTHRNEIDVVITDMMMPNMDGAAVIQELARLNPQTKIIAASGLVSNENVADIHSPNVHAFLPKPYKAEKLFWVLDALLH